MPAFDEYAPFDSGLGSSAMEATWRKMMRYQMIPGVIRDVANELNVYGDSSGMQVKCQTGECLISGHWGNVTSEKIITINGSHATLPRRDLIVARADFTLKKVVVEKVTGTAASTPLVPQPTINSSMHEIPLAVVSVPAGASTITAANVQRARQWGGDTVPTIVDDFFFFGDKVSTCQRAQVDVDVPVTANTAYFSRMQSPIKTTISQITFYISRVRIGGTIDVRIFYGPQQDELKSFVDPVNYNFTATGLTTGTFSPIELAPNSRIVVYIRGSSGITQSAFMAGLAATSNTSTVPSELLNPNTFGQMSCGFRTESSTPSTLNIVDGSWSRRDRYFWAALS